MGSRSFDAVRLLLRDDTPAVCRRTLAPARQQRHTLQQRASVRVLDALRLLLHDMAMAVQVVLPLGPGSAVRVHALVFTTNSLSARGVQVGCIRALSRCHQ